MSRKNANIKAGIFIVIVILGVFLGHIWLSNRAMHQKGRIIAAIFTDISGLKIGDPVKVYGVDKGKVVDIKVVEKEVDVKMWLEYSVKLYSDVSISIQDVAMISGTKCIILHPGESDTLYDESNPIIGNPNLGLSTIEIGTIAQEADSLVNILKLGLSNTRGALKNVEDISDNLNNMIKENKKDIRALTKNLSKGTKDLGPTIAKLNKTSDKLDTILTIINQKHGTLGKLIYEDSLYNNLNNATKALTDLLKDIKKNPKRYFKLLF